MFEGSIGWMYLDRKGNVTAGVGEVLISADAAVKIPFMRSNAELASDGEIRQDYARVKAMLPGLRAAAYRSPSALLLNGETITRLLNGKLIEKSEQLVALFPRFDRFPITVKTALLDMAFNLGVAGIVTKFPDFIESVHKENWSGAADNCKRLDVSNERNDWTRAQFFAAIV
jgi:GH24 family phage-related lysozyme (muramidase)